MIYRASSLVNGNEMYVHTVLVRQVSTLESSNSDDKTWKENNIKLAQGKTVVKFMGLKLPRGLTLYLLTCRIW
jgi:hypothetical protein